VVTATALWLVDRIGRWVLLPATSFAGGGLHARVRDPAKGWLTANLVVALTFLDLVDRLGHSGVFFLYAGLTAGAFVFAYVLVPETKGLSLEAVQALWRARAQGTKPAKAAITASRSRR